MLKSLHAVRCDPRKEIADSVSSENGQPKTAGRFHTVVKGAGASAKTRLDASTQIPNVASCRWQSFASD